MTRGQSRISQDWSVVWRVLHVPWGLWGVNCFGCVLSKLLHSVPRLSDGCCC